MKNKTFLVSVLTILVLAGILGIALTGCGTDKAAAENLPPVNVSVDNQQQGISVSGEGKVTVTPDIATLSLGVSAQASRVVDAQSQAATAMDKVISTLTSNGVAQKDIKTQYFSIQALTTYNNTTQQSTITGYMVSNTVTVKVRAIDKVGPIIDAVAEAGGDLTRINSISFSVDNPEQYYPQARQLAMNDAQTKAQQLASLAEVTLGRATYISESTSGPPVPYPVYERNAAGQAVPSPATSINPGETDITVDVQVVYAIQ
jgi:uncharacterized protein YggE